MVDWQSNVLASVCTYVQERQNIRKLLSKSHRERIDDFNMYLSNLTEHNDIPRVSAAGNG